MPSMGRSKERCGAAWLVRNGRRGAEKGQTAPDGLDLCLRIDDQDLAQPWHERPPKVPVRILAGVFLGKLLPQQRPVRRYPLALDAA